MSFPTAFITRTAKRHGSKVVGTSTLLAALGCFVWLQDHIVWKTDFKDAVEAQARRIGSLEDRQRDLERILLRNHNERNTP